VSFISHYWTTVRAMAATVLTACGANLFHFLLHYWPWLLLFWPVLLRIRAVLSRFWGNLFHFGLILVLSVASLDPLT
ncbi:hypothetical protein HUSEC_26291, partial [Escherichia coli O104:H4 str. LB226692]